MMQLNQVISTIKHNKGTSLLVVLQVALTLMIVSNAVFSTLTNLELWAQETGLDEQRLLLVRHQVFDPNVDVGQLIDNDIKALKNIDQIDDVLLTSEIPLDSQWTNISNVYLDNSEDAKEQPIESFDSSEKLLGMIDAKVIEGRNFAASEVIRGEFGQVPSTPAAVMVSEAFAKAVFVDKSAVGQTLWLSKGSSPVRIVGVYSDFLAGEALENYHTMIKPLTIWRTDGQLNYLLKANVEVTTPLLDQITDTLYQSRGRYVSVVESLSRPKKRMYDGRGSHSFTLLGISVIAIIVTGLGITGLVTFTVNQRKRQIGIRRALGGSKKQIVNFFIMEISLLTAAGVVLGLLLTVIMNYVLADQSGGENNMQWLPLIGLVALIWLINLLASWLPAKRAAQIEPAIVTRGL